MSCRAAPLKDKWSLTWGWVCAGCLVEWHTSFVLNCESGSRDALDYKIFLYFQFKGFMFPHSLVEVRCYWHGREGRLRACLASKIFKG